MGIAGHCRTVTALDLRVAGNWDFVSFLMEGAIHFRTLKSVNGKKMSRIIGRAGGGSGNVRFGMPMMGMSESAESLAAALCHLDRWVTKEPISFLTIDSGKVVGE